MAVALLDVEARISQLGSQLPQGTSYTARRMDPEVFPIFAFSLTSNALNDIQLRDLAKYNLAPALSTVAGVAHIEVQGGQSEEYRVSVDPIRMRAHSLTISDIAKALRASQRSDGRG